MKKIPLFIISIAWVLETIALIIFTMAIMGSLEIERINLWLNSLGPLTLLVGAQGTAAFGGPLISEKINQKEH